MAELKQSAASRKPVRPGSGLGARLTLGISRLALEETAIYAAWRWVLPQFGVELPLFVLILTMVAWAAFAIVRFVAAWRILRKPETPGLPSLVGSTGRVLTPLAPQGTVKIKGETWTATLVEGDRAEVGDEVTVTDMDGLRLFVRRAGNPLLTSGSPE